MKKQTWGEENISEIVFAIRRLRDKKNKENLFEAVGIKYYEGFGNLFWQGREFLDYLKNNNKINLKNKIDRNIYNVSEMLYKETNYRNIKECVIERKKNYSEETKEELKTLIKQRLSEDDEQLKNLEEKKEERIKGIKKFLDKYRYIRKEKPLSEILKISDEKLNELYAKIKPVINQEGKLYYIKDVNLRNTAYTWEPIIKEEAKGLKKLRKIYTYHEYGFHGFFKPSIAEVLAQLPKRSLEKIAAFEIPIGENDPDPEQAGNYHEAITILYKKTD